MHSTLRTVLASGITALVVSAITVTTLVPRLQSTVATPGSTLSQSVSTQTTVREESAIMSAVKKSEPAVVSVIISKNLPVMEQYYQDLPHDPFFSPFLGGNLRIPQYRQNGTEKEQIGGGTAFFISSNGLLMTNKHVIDDPKAEYTVLLNDGRKLEAKVVGQDPTNDIALMKVEGKDFPFLELGDSSQLQLGQTVIAIGNALGEFRNTVSVGVISGLQRSIQAGSNHDGSLEQLSHIIQTDAAINPGNSGGPLINNQGQVVAMSTAVASQGENIGFAIPAGDLEHALQTYRQYGRIVRPYLGIRYTMITPDLKEKNHLGEDHGALVQRGEDQTELAVLPGSPADKAGIEENDIILAIDGENLGPDSTLSDAIQGKNIGDQITLTIARKGAERHLQVALEEWKE